MERSGQPLQENIPSSNQTQYLTNKIRTVQNGKFKNARKRLFISCEYVILPWYFGAIA